MKHNEKQFQKNVELWAKYHPKEAVMLPYLEGISLDFCECKNGELNLKRTDNNKPHYYHSVENPLQEAEEWFKELELQDVPYLYVYGLGLGYYYDAAKQWLEQDPKHRIVFLEDNLEVIRRFLETDRAAEMLQDPQVLVHYFQDLKDKEGVFEVLYWSSVMTRVAVSSLKSYAEKEMFPQLHHKIVYDAAKKNALVEEYLGYGIGFFKNFYPNILELHRSYFGNNFFGKFQKIPAIICGAGPSLTKNIPLLKSLSDKALIFAGGSALNVLNSAGFMPHFGAGIDPNAAQYERLSTNQAFELPFFYRNRMFYGAFRAIHGPRLYVTGCGGYDVSEFFEEKFGIKTDFLDEGHNVINFCVEVANAMGCNPIIFVGVDLAFTGMQAYADGVVDNAVVTEKEILETDDYDSKAMLKADIYGQPVYTLWKWIAESDWIGDYAESHQNITMLNATEGGIGFRGIANVTLADVAKQYLQHNYDFKDRIHGEIQNSAMPQITFDKLLEATEELRDSLKRCVEDFDILSEDAQEMIKKLKKEKKSEGSTQSGRAALFETELAEEPGYKYVLDVFNAVLSRIMSRDLMLLRTRKKPLAEWQKNIKKLELNLKRFTFLKEVAQVNIKLIQMALDEKKEA